MKHTLKFFLCLASLFLISKPEQTSAQSNGVDILNVAPCDVFFQLVGGPSSGCVITSVSDVFSFAAGQTQLFSDPTAVPLPGLSATDYILGVIILDKDRCPCGQPVTNYMIGDPCTTLPTAVSYPAEDAMCNPCNNINATWTPNAPIANLDFN